MMKREILSAAAVAALSLAVTAKEPIDYVNPLIGTASRRADTGNSAGMMPYVCPPFAAVEWVPMTRLSEVGILSFAAPDAKFLGFIGSRQPAIWMGEWGQLSVAPQASAEPVCDYMKRGLELDKAQCVYTPYYAKIVTKEGVVAELAGASHAAIMRFTYPEGAPKRLVFDASRVFLGCISCTNAFPGAIEFAGGGKVRTWNKDFVDLNNSDPKSAPHVKYVVECSEPYAATGVYEGGTRTGFRQKHPGGPIPYESYPVVAQKPGAKAVEGDCVGGWADFPGKGRTLLVKIGSSTIDEATAQANLDREIGAGFDFDKVVAATKAAWVRQLSSLSIEAPEDVKTIFYTAMYHASLYPRDISEGGRYLSPYDGKVREGDMYTNYSMWDTYRAEHALLTFIAPDRVDGMMNALLNAYREGGWLPKWPNPGYTGQMVGGCAEMLLAEAYSKGFRGFDVNTAYAAVKKNATVPQVNDDEVRWADRQYWTGHNETRGGLANYMRLGYVAADVTAESVSRTQDFGLNDTAAAILADATGHPDDAKMFRARMRNYTNLWDAAHQRFWPKNKDGQWAATLHGGWNMTIGNDYTEQSPETAIWGIPYDVPGLIALCGGRDAFERKLDDYFDRKFWTGRSDGLSHHENETTHHISYLYAAAGFHEKTAKNVRRILTETYSAREWGMEGNEDCGQMSAWYILSSLGFYPLNPATDEYVIGSPLVEKAVLKIGAPYRAATFTILAKNQSKANYVVKSVKLNGVELKDRILRQKDVVAGGTLEFEMAPPEPLPLFGDGVHDDTAAIQSRLDSGLSCVYLPPPAKEYLISKTLRIGSDTELKLDRFTVIRLAPKSDCPMIQNKGYVSGGDDRRIALTGGIWDMANVDQSPNPQQRGRVQKGYKLPNNNLMTHVNGFFWGMAMRFSNVENMTVKGITIRNPTSYGIAFCHTSYLYVDDVSFDYVKCNPIFLNMDGVHLDGWCHHAKISNLRGTCFDDLVAINANDGGCSQHQGPISDVDIDGVYADYCHSAVRLLSAPCPVERVTIRNVHGNFYTYAVGLTHYFPQNGRGWMNDIVISDVFAAKVFSPDNIGRTSRVGYPLIFVQNLLDVGNLTIRNVAREERNISIPTIRVDKGATVKHLTVRDCRHVGHLDKPVPFYLNQGRVEKETFENNDVRE